MTVPLSTWRVVEMRIGRKKTTPAIVRILHAWLSDSRRGRGKTRTKGETVKLFLEVPLALDGALEQIRSLLPGPRSEKTRKSFLVRWALDWYADQKPQAVSLNDLPRKPKARRGKKEEALTGELLGLLARLRGENASP